MLASQGIGSNGRLGNQMFQYASLRGIAAHHGYDFCIPESNFKNEYADHQLFEAFELFGLKNIGKPINYPIICEQSFNFDEDLFELCPDNVCIFGHFQTEKYFKHIEEEIRKDFIFKENIILDCLKYRESISSGDTISIHVRRTDYVDNNFYFQCELDYYKLALSEFGISLPVIVFSDDINWCKNQDLFKSDRFKFCESNSNLFDLCLISLCNYHIISNSTFSWWGAWLSKGEVIAPSQWFSKNKKDIIDRLLRIDYITKSLPLDIYPDNWHVL